MNQFITRLLRPLTAHEDDSSDGSKGWQKHGVGSAREVYTEFRGHRGVDATRYGDWEYSGRCTDFE